MAGQTLDPAVDPSSQSQGTNAVELRDITYGYDPSVNVLEGLELAIKPREIVGVIGPSVCGKSTLLRLIAEFVRPSKGTVSVSIDKERGGCPLSMMFQIDTLLPWLTAEENVLLFSRFKRYRGGLSRGELVDHAHRMLSMVHLDHASELYPYQMSGGMKRRLAFATSVAPMPQILLLDEPFSSIDEPTRIKIHQDVFDIVRKLGLTTLLVTHDLGEALTLCDRVVILTQRPAVVYSIHDMPFGTTRSIMSLRDQPEFLEMYGRVWHDLSSQL